MQDTIMFIHKEQTNQRRILHLIRRAWLSRSYLSCIDHCRHTRNNVNLVLPSVLIDKRSNQIYQASISEPMKKK